VGAQLPQAPLGCRGHGITDRPRSGNLSAKRAGSPAD
jgi:hypothetical protein